MFTTKSCYQAFFRGSIIFEPWRRLWKSWAQPKCKMFLWLAIRNKCWTADNLEKRGLSHLETCPLCDQGDETIQHLLTSCVVARQFWYHLITPFGLVHLTPRTDEASFADWWRRASKGIQKDKRKGFNSAIILGAWSIWLQRNRTVFDGDRPTVRKVQQRFQDDSTCWTLAGARHI
jgi:hypothetical protein